MLEQYDTAISYLSVLVLSSPGSVTGRANLAACFAALDRIDEAQSEVKAMLEISPGYSLTHAAFAAPYKDKSSLDHFLALLRRSGLPE
jgi:Tetratricopeptide repeat